MSLSEETNSSGLELDVEFFFEWRGPVKNPDGKITSMWYQARGENFYFPFVDEDYQSTGFVYQKLKIEKAPSVGSHVLWVVMKDRIQRFLSIR